jgi:hypothetical protein
MTGRQTATRLALVALTLASAGCHTFSFHVSDALSDPTPVVDRKTFWLFGIFPAHDVDVRAICPAGVGAIDEETTFSDVLFTAFTLEIYTPRTSSYYCRLPQAPLTPPPAAITP